MASEFNYIKWVTENKYGKQQLNEEKIWTCNGPCSNCADEMCQSWETVYEHGFQAGSNMVRKCSCREGSSVNVHHHGGAIKKGQTPNIKPKLGLREQQMSQYGCCQSTAINYNQYIDDNEGTLGANGYMMVCDDCMCIDMYGNGGNNFPGNSGCATSGSSGGGVTSSTGSASTGSSSTGSASTGSSTGSAGATTGSATGGTGGTTTGASGNAIEDELCKKYFSFKLTQQKEFCKKCDQNTSGNTPQECKCCDKKPKKVNEQGGGPIPRYRIDAGGCIKCPAGAGPNNCPYLDKECTIHYSDSYSGGVGHPGGNDDGSGGAGGFVSYACVDNSCQMTPGWGPFATESECMSSGCGGGPRPGGPGSKGISFKPTAVAKQGKAAVRKTRNIKEQILKLLNKK